MHVGVAIAATGIFTVAFGASVLQVLQQLPRGSPRPSTRPPSPSGTPAVRPLRALGRPPGFGWLEQVPGARDLEALSFRLNAVAFVLWTFTLIGGAIWAEHAWGRYWGWDPKEVGTFVVWVVYAAYLHARTTRGWSGRRASCFVVRRLRRRARELHGREPGRHRQALVLGPLTRAAGRDRRRVLVHGRPLLGPGSVRRQDQAAGGVRRRRAGRLASSSSRDRKSGSSSGPMGGAFRDERRASAVPARPADREPDERRRSSGTKSISATQSTGCTPRRSSRVLRRRRSRSRSSGR